jgi:hypothetical protein
MASETEESLLASADRAKSERAALREAHQLPPETELDHRILHCRVTEEFRRRVLLPSLIAGGASQSEIRQMTARADEALAEMLLLEERRTLAAHDTLAAEATLVADFDESIMV